jgi:hypothetical protein
MERTYCLQPDPCYMFLTATRPGEQVLAVQNYPFAALIRFVDVHSSGGDSGSAQRETAGGVLAPAR